MSTVYKLTDLHCHFLPGMDDGATNEQMALQLLKAEYDSGIHQVALTSHFDCEKTKLNNFLEMRNQSLERLNIALSKIPKDWNNLRMKVGAEVFFSPNLCRIDMKKLCLEGTPFLLLELPTDSMPLYFDETVYEMQSCGIIPLIAHIERYPYVMDNPLLLCDWIDRGIYTQINAGTILKSGRKARFCCRLIEWNLVHVLASDAHSICKRPPNLTKGLELIHKRFGQDTVDILIENANCIFHGDFPEIKAMYCPEKFLGRWK